MEDNAEQMRTHRGPYFQGWRKQTAASVGGVLLDAERDRAL